MQITNLLTPGTPPDQYNDNEDDSKRNRAGSEHSRKTVVFRDQAVKGANIADVFYVEKIGTKIVANNETSKTQTGKGEDNKPKLKNA